jgi:hypothetical protein
MRHGGHLSQSRGTWAACIQVTPGAAQVHYIKKTEGVVNTDFRVVLKVYSLSFFPSPSLSLSLYMYVCIMYISREDRTAGPRRCTSACTPRYV